MFTTDSVHPRDRFDQWHKAACREIVPHDGAPQSPAPFVASLRTGTIGELRLVEFRTSPLKFSYTAAHVAPAAAGDLFGFCLLEGTAELSQNARDLVLKPGMLTMLDPLLPCEGRLAENAASLILKIPRRQVEARIGRNRELIARPIGADSFDDSLAVCLSRRLPALAGQMMSITEGMVCSHAIDLISTAIARAMGGPRARISSGKALVLASLRAAIEQRLADPEIDAAGIASAAGVSVRYANELLAEQDTSIKRLVLARRLARCRAALEDPTQSHRSISEIAFGWGFSDLTHFGRRFAETYGVRPREYQALAKRAGASRF